jgi:flagellar protein FlaH
LTVLSFELERDELNKKLGSGFPGGSIVLIEGSNGSGKSALAQRIAFGLLNNETTVTFISTQLTTKGYINQMYSLNYPIIPYLLKNQLLYIPVLPLVKSSIIRSDFIERLMGAKKLFDNNVIIIDTLSSLIRASADSNKSIELISFFKKMTGIEKTIMITVDGTELEKDILSEFSSSCDVNITLKQKTVGSDIKRTIVVNKFTGARSPVGNMVGFRIEPNVGLVVEIASVT